jgi:hypothetical protein
MAGSELEPEEVLECARQSLPPLVSLHASEIRVIYPNPTGARLVKLGEQLDQRSLTRAVLTDYGNDSAGGQLKAHVVQHESIGSRIGKRDVLELDAPGEARGNGLVGGGDERGSIVLQPGEASGVSSGVWQS